MQPPRDASPHHLALLEPLLEMEGTVDHLVYHNENNGYTVLRLSLAGKDNSVVVVGCMPNPQPGVRLSVTGRWTENPRFGRQFHMESFEERLPATAEGIRHYLGSGLIKGVREVTASRIVKAFGQDTFRILDEEPDKLAFVKGVGAKTAERIKTAWKAHIIIRDLIMFLQPHGVSTSYAVRIHRHYGADALAVVRENPYRLAMDIPGIGFLTADKVAEKLGFEKDSALRAEAGVLYALRRFSEEGHVYYPMEKLTAAASTELGIEASLAEQAIKTLEQAERVILDVQEDSEGGQTAVYLARYYHCEHYIAYYLKKVLHSPKSVSFDDPAAALSQTLSRLDIRLAPAQEEAVYTAMTQKVMVITGGPGTGKTTVINAVIQAFAAKKARILLAAPTGRAAKRLGESCGLEARTIHRLLEYSPREDGFARNEDNPLPCSLLVVDEASMMDTLLMYHLVKAVPLGATLVFVGDVNQLPSVGPGNVLKDIIGSNAVPVVTLTEIFRQAAESEIILNAHRINNGEAPNLENQRDRLADFYFIRQDDADKAAETIVELVKDRLPRRFGLHPVNDIQVITPMHKGDAGTGALNQRLQQALNRQTIRVQRGERTFCLDDKVMQIRNNYEKDVFNGDIGRICLVQVEDRELTVSFDGHNVLYAFDELDEIVPAYAISVHKSQGSEYPAIVMPVLTQHYMLLQRNLLYTAVTRGKRLVVLVGSVKAIHMAVHNNRTQKRYTWLAQRLRQGLA